jgi:hypothetical protein
MIAAERKRLREQHNAATAVCEECKLTGAHGPTCSKRPAAPRDLGSPDVQEEIVHPEPVPLTIGGEPFELHPLAAFYQKQLVRVTGAIFNAAALDPDARFLPYTIRLGIAASENAKLAALIARAEHPASVLLEDAVAEARGAEIVAATDYEELSNAFGRMFDLNRLAKVFDADPKSKATSAKTTS